MASDDERYLPEPPQRSLLARLLALAALAGVIVVVVMMVSSSLGSDDEPADTGVKVEKQKKKKKDGDGAETPKEYAVESGDSLSSIAAKFGISVKRIERLNPKLDPNTLATGQVIKLR